MKYLLIISIGFIILSCGREDKKERPLEDTAAFSTKPLNENTTATTPNDTLDDGGNPADYQTMYIVVADTATRYDVLHKEMFDLHAALNQDIDTMGRYYDKKLGKIILPEDDEDEAYAGDYYPRRFASSSISLEYLEMYSDKTTPQTIALVTGIYPSVQSADSAVVILRKKMPGAFTVKSEVYMGCIH